MDPEPLTLSDIDTARPLRTDDELLRLVAAIHGSRREAQETNWLEWKSSLDLTKAPGKFAVAKAVLGFANRSVDDARTSTGGVAYMIVGVQPGAASGVTPIDHADLTSGIKTYASTPRFTPRALRFAGVEVLVVVVEPPEPGDSIHTLQKQYEKFDAGVIFHRGPARTAPAGPKEVEMLSDRLLRGVRQPDLDLKLLCTAEPLLRFKVGRMQIEEWLSRREVYIRATSGEPVAPPLSPSNDHQSIIGDVVLSNVFAGFGLSTHANEAAEFDRRVKNYLNKLGRVLRAHVVRSIVQDENANVVCFRAVNATDDPVSGVQLTIRIPKSQLVVYTTPPRVDSWPSKPKWPDLADEFRPMVTAYPRPLMENYVPVGLGVGGSIADYDDAVEVTWDVGDLRPGEPSRKFDITIVAGPKASEQFDVTMVARAMDRRGNATSTETITVSSMEWTIDDFYNAEADS